MHGVTASEIRVLGLKANELLNFDAVELLNEFQGSPARPLNAEMARIGTGSNYSIWIKILKSPRICHIKFDD